MKPMASAIAERAVEAGHAMIACSGCLGVFVAARSLAAKCPGGWVFVESETATPELVDEAIKHAMSGRATWPSPDRTY